MYETIIENTHESTVNVSGNKITSLRNTATHTTAVRFYKDNRVSVAGQEGAADVPKLIKRAETDLPVCGVPYPCMLEKNVKHVDRRKNPIAPETFLDAMRDLLDRIQKVAPQFIFGNKLKRIESALSYTNTAGADLYSVADRLEIGLTIKERTSANIMDLSYGGTLDYFDPQAITDDIADLAAAYSRRVELPADIPVILDARLILSMLLEDMIADVYLSGSGKLKDKLGETLFHDKLTVAVRYNAASHSPRPFFDAEGTVLTDDGFKLIENGKFCGLLSTNRAAAQFGIPLSGGASTGAYDAVPSYGGNAIYADETADSVSKLCDRAIYVAVASGGDITDKGDVGIPVQAAFLLENGKLVGRLPELMLSGSIFDICGKNFLGVSSQTAFRCDHAPLFAAGMKVAKQ